MPLRRAGDLLAASVLASRARSGQSGCLTEDDFWKHLEYRVDAEFEGSPDRRYRWVWCDGFIPDHPQPDDDPRVIQGVAWIDPGSGQRLWRFALLLPGPITDRAAFDWSAVLPPDDVTGWLAPDFAEEYLEIEPAAAVPDDE